MLNKYNFKKSNKYIIIVALIALLYNINNISFTNLVNEHAKKVIFTFWEPRIEIPGYIQLCLNTWKKFIPEYEIKILDYQNTKNYLGKELFSNIICKDMSLPQQADAIRVAILNKYGGIWMDADTIILNGSFIKSLKNFELAMIGDIKSKKQDIGFIYSSRNSCLLKTWLKEIIKNVLIYRQIIYNKRNNKSLNVFPKRLKKWNYLGNGIIDKYLKNITNNSFYRIDRNKLIIFPERKFYKNSSINNIQKYKLFYFGKGEVQNVLNEAKDIILLHNSWTPKKYKNMTKVEFLKQNILLSKLLTKLLEKK